MNPELFGKKWAGLLVVSIIIALVVVGGFLYLQSQPKPQEYAGPVEKLNFSSSPGVKNAALYIANSKGYFQEERLEVNINNVPLAKQAFLNMLEGKGVDISAVADTVAAVTAFNRKDFYILATISEGHDDKVVARKDKGINAVADLKGKKVGLPNKGTSAHFFLSTLLAFNGLAETDVKITILEPEKLLSALENGTLDAIALWEPDASAAAQLLQDNAVVFLNQDIYRKTFNLMVSKDFARNHPETLKRFLRAIDKANKFREENEEESQTLVAEILKLDKKEVVAIWDENNNILSLDQSLLLTLEDEARWAIRTNLTNSTEIPNYLDFIYTDALEKVRPEAITMIK